MGANIQMQGRAGKWEDITPGWRSQMASWLLDIGCRSPMVLTEDDLPALRLRRAKQLKGRAEPPFDQSPDWTKCFDRIIRRIRRHGQAIITVEY